MDNVLMHYGILRRSGRYPWGSGKDPYQRSKGFLGYVKELRSQGLSDKEIAKGVGLTTTQLRNLTTLARYEQRQGDANFALKLKEKGYSNTAIAERMGINESSVRNLLKPAMAEKAAITMATAEMLKKRVNETGLIDVGSGVEAHIGISRTKMKAALQILEEEGYKTHEIYIDQLGTGKKTTMLVLAPPDMTYSEVYKNRYSVEGVNGYTEDGGKTWRDIEPPLSISSKRVMIRYAEEGGLDKDGVIELRRNADNLSLGAAHYAQVRIAVDDKMYLKGMAMYSDGIPDGYDIVFNTNKKRGTPMESVLKKMSDDPGNPFGASITRQSGALNIVNEEGDWAKWSKELSSQFLSKQSPKLAREQLKLYYDDMKAEYDEIMKLTNPAVKKKLLDSFADDCDSSAVHLKAAALPRSAIHVILPVPELKENEVYAPNYRNGEKLVLVRYPHAGIFELPEVTVNNNSRKAKSVMGEAIDAIGIHPKVAEVLSGADFDGDFVLAIPNSRGEIKRSSPLKGLEGFDPKTQYKLPDDAPQMSNRTKQIQMGNVSNLITDMTLQGATSDELCRAVRHSMVVIDAEKHHLDYKQSAIDNGISALKEKYQGSKNSGASTLISRASKETHVLDRRLKEIDKETGKKIYEDTGRTTKSFRKEVDGSYTLIGEKKKTIKSTRMAETDDAFTLSSGTRMEAIYAEHANSLKALANEARKSSMATKSTTYNPTANKAYAAEVASLNAKLNTAVKNSPLERKAQLLANYRIDAKKKDNPDMDSSTLKKLKSKELDQARVKVGAKKQRVNITDKEWEAIQAGAVSNNTLTRILNNTDLDKIKALATPRTSTTMNSAKIARARSMMARGYTQAEVADALGVSVSTIVKALSS